MASRREVKVFITGDTSGLEKAAGQVGGLSNKMKGAIAGIGAGVGLASIGRGLFNAANKFKDASLAANDFATASGLAGEDAARFLEVASDLSVETKTLETALGRLSKGLGKDEEKWKDYGVAVAKTAEGAVDVKRTFLGAIDVLNRTTNPLEKNRIGAELFGRSWAELAPLIELGAAGVEQALNNVSDAQARVGSEENVEKAKKYRDAMDELSDKGVELGNTLAEDLIPRLSDALSFFAGLDPKVVTVGVGILAAAVAVSKLSGALTLLAANPAILAIGALAVTVWKLVDGINRLQNSGHFTPVGFTPEAAARINARAPGTIDSSGNAAGAEKNTKSNWQAARDGILNIFKADGGPVSMGSPYVVGERGPEVFVPGRSGTIIPNGAGMSIGVVNVYGVTDLRSFQVRLEREAARQRRGAA